MTVRYRFEAFELSPPRRVLLRAGHPVPLIPKYFDLLLLLIRRRHEAVTKDDLFAAVWPDVAVSDGALSQAIRTIRRALGDNPRQPIFIRTVSRHGYQFVWPTVVEDTASDVAGSQVHSVVSTDPGAHPPPSSSEVAALVDRLLAAPDQDDDARDIAEQLHELGTVAAIRALSERPGHAAAVALMRDARWDVAGAGEVPLSADGEFVPAVLALVRLRLHEARRAIAARWLGAATGGALGGALAGAIGGALLALAPTSTAHGRAVLTLALIGAAAGAVGAAGIGAGLAAAETLARGRRGLALAACGSVAGALTAGLAAVILRALLESLFSVRLAAGPGALEGWVLGAACGSGYAVATPQPPGGGMAAPSGRRRWTVAAVTGTACAAAAIALAWSGHLLVGGLVHEVARTSRDAPLVLAPLGRLVGEPGFGPLTQALLSAFEGGVFGGALAWGLTRRPSR